MVSGDAEIIERPELPDLGVELFVHSQFVMVGYSQLYEYRPSMNYTNAFGFLKTPGLDLGLYGKRLSKFVSYDAIRGLIIIDGQKAIRQDIGEYELCYYVTFSN